jgi:S1-C subfamily serine protease
MNFQVFVLLSILTVVSLTGRRRSLPVAPAVALGARRGIRLLAIALIVGLTLIVPFEQIVGAQSAQTQTSTQAGNAVDIFKQVGPAVVTILNEQEKSHFLRPSTEEVAAAGSGFFIDDQGHIVTNNHVVAKGNQFEAIFTDGTSQPATLVGTDPISDLAVLQVKATPPGVTTLGDSSLLEPGQPVLAIGSPLETFTNTVTEGIVGAIGRSLAEDPNNPGLHLTGLIQHDAAINPGNSGGPLVNMAGEVIGVNTLAVTEAEPGVSAQGLFFAIPSNTVKRVSAELIATGHVVYPYLGVSDTTDLTPQLAKFFGLPVDHGVYVGNVENGSPADAAGMKDDDIIVAVDDTELGENASLTDVLFTHKPGDQVQVTVAREDGQHTLTVTLGGQSST